MTLAIIINIGETINLVVALILLVSIIMCGVYLNQIRDILKDMHDHALGERKAHGSRYSTR